MGCFHSKINNPSDRQEYLKSLLNEYYTVEQVFEFIWIFGWNTYYNAGSKVYNYSTNLSAGIGQ
ncbi:unnamed protein product [marine sediment metagenome]|uniref:Uncharacterized protein n=1 Tax=marine sediment metagenome TaxID=412755 RepID=X1CKH9_9ZZZZ